MGKQIQKMVNDPPNWCCLLPPIKEWKICAILSQGYLHFTFELSPTTTCCGSYQIYQPTGVPWSFSREKAKNGDSWATDLPSKGLSPVLRDYTNVAASQDIHGQPPWKSKQARKTPGGPRKAAGQAGDFHLGDQMWKWFLGMSINDVISYKLYIIYSYISILIPK